MGNDSTRRAEPITAELAGLHRLARFLVHGADSEDLVQRTAVAALEQDLPPHRLGAWLRQVMRNQAHDGHRRDARRAVWESKADAPGSPALAPDEHAFQAELREGVMAALRSLPEMYRVALEQRFLGDRSPASFAAELGCSPNAARWRVHEGLRRLRIEMDRRFEGRQQWHRGLLLMLGAPQVMGTATGGSSALSGDGAASASTQQRGNMVNQSQSGSTTSAAATGQAAPAGMSVAKPILLVTASIAALTIGIGAASRLDASRESSVVTGQDTRPNSVRSTRADASLGAIHSERTLPSMTPVEPAPRLPVAAVAGNDDPQRRLTMAAAIPFHEVCQEERHAAGIGDVETRYDVRWEGHAEQPAAVRITSGCVDCTNSFDPETCAKEPTLKCSEGESPAEHPELADCFLEWLAAAAPPSHDVDGSRVASAAQPGLAGNCPPGPDCTQGYLPPANPTVAELEASKAVDAMQLFVQGSRHATETIYVCTSYFRQVEELAQLAEQLVAAAPNTSVTWVGSPTGGAVRGTRAMVAAQAQGHFESMLAYFREDPAAGIIHDDLMVFAEHKGLDLSRFEQDLYSEQTSQRVADQRSWCRRRGVYEDPSLIVAGERIEGVPSLREVLTRLGR